MSRRSRTSSSPKEIRPQTRTSKAHATHSGSTGPRQARTRDAPTARPCLPGGPCCSQAPPISKGTLTPASRNLSRRAPPRHAERNPVTPSAATRCPTPARCSRSLKSSIRVGAALVAALATPERAPTRDAPTRPCQPGGPCRHGGPCCGQHGKSTHSRSHAARSAGHRTHAPARTESRGRGGSRTALHPIGGAHRTARPVPH